MHFVCSLYAFPTAYIYALSALRTRLFAFLYALYAVNSGVVFSHSMHSRFFDAYNAYKSQAMWFVMNCGRLRPKGTGNEAWWAIRMVQRYPYMSEGANRKFDCPKMQTVEDGRTGNIKKKWKRNSSLFYSLCARTHLYALCMQSVCILKCIHFQPLSPTDTPIRVSVCIVCSQFRSCVLT